MNNEEKNIPEEVSAPETVSAAPAKEENKKLPKNVIAMIVSGFVLLALALAAMFVLIPGGDNGQTGNGGDNGGATTPPANYTVVVVDNEGNAVVGAKVTFTTPGGIPFPGTTDAEGKAVLDHNEDGVTVKVISVPRGYEYSKLNVEQSFDAERKLTVTVTALAPIVINVVDDSGAPVAGVLVQMCDTSGSCRLPTTTDEEGKGYYAFEEGQFKAQLTNGAPEGYTVEDPTAYYPIVDGEVTIVLTKIAD